VARWALGGALLLAACSGSLKPGDPGTAGGGDAGTTGSAGVSGDAGAAGTRAVGGDAGYGYSGTYGGDAGTSGTCSFPFTGPGCPPGNCAAGTGNCGAPSGGTGGSAGSGASTGTAGTVGTTPPLPACVGGTPSFGICFMSDADVLPLPALSQDQGVSTTGVAAIVGVGTGSAPASCESARAFGVRGTSDWWFQAKAADNHVWTIGVHGLGNAPLVHKDDTVTLNLVWRGYQISGFGPPYGELQLSDASATPLLWASADKNTTTWLTLTPGAATCAFTNSCDVSRSDVVASINGSTTTVPSFGAAYLGGYYLAVGQSVKTAANQCSDYFGPGLAAAAAKVPLNGP
jgi:hypothetical protein